MCVKYTSVYLMLLTALKAVKNTLKSLHCTLEGILAQPPKSKHEMIIETFFQICHILIFRCA